jgi:hypothetical protein
VVQRAATQVVASTTAGLPAPAAHQGQPPGEQGSAPGLSGSDGSGPAADETGGAPAGTSDEVTPQPPADQAGAGAGPCADALAWVAGAGLSLPAGVGYHCPSDEFPHHGAACWNPALCSGAPFIAVNLDLMAGTGTSYLHHVVAHEICHILDFGGDRRLERVER